MAIELMYLQECQEHIPSLAKLWYEEISRHWNKEASIEKAHASLVKHAQLGALPMAIVAIDDGNPIGLACLRETDGIRPGVTPWLGSLVVCPKSRKSKVGERLIDAIKAQAKIMEYETLYLLAFDPTIPNWYARLGWQMIGDDELLGHRVAVMSIPL